MQIKPFLLSYADKQDYTLKVFEFLTKHILFTHSWSGGTTGFGTQNKEIISAYEDGLKQGFFYRAWSIVLSSNNNFAPLFHESIAPTPQNNFEKIIEDISKVCVEIIEDPKDNADLFQSNCSDNDDREDKRTRRIKSKTKPYFEGYIDFQHKTGVSATGKQKREGTVDLAFFDKKKKRITNGEALNCQGLNSTKLNNEIIKHIDKLMENYNKSRIDNLLFLVYYEGKKFYQSFENYIKYFEQNYPDSSIKEITTDFVQNSSVIKIIKSKYSYSNNSKNLFNIYHLYIDFSE